MKFHPFLISKKAEAALLLFCFVAGLMSAMLGLNEQTSIFVYISSFFFYFLFSRLSLGKSAGIGLLTGALYGAYLYIWLIKFASIQPYHIAILFMSLTLCFSFVFASYFSKKFPHNEFAQIFPLGIAFYTIRTIFHYSPVLPFAKAFMTISNTPTVFDWLVPIFGSSFVDVLVLATGCFFARALYHIWHRKISNNFVRFAVFFSLLVIGSWFIPLVQKASDSGRPVVRVALVQGNFDWSWDVRMANTDQMLRYFAEESGKAAQKGAKIIVWPEYAVPKDLLHGEPGIGETIANLSHKLNAVIVLGTLENVPGPARPDGKWNGYDVSLVFDPQQVMLEPYRAVFPFTDNVLSGTKPVVFDSEYARFPVISCFEVANHKFVSDYNHIGSPFDFYIGIANIQLFNGTAGHARIKNHLRRIVAENGKYFVYVANTGPSIVFNQFGDEVARTDSGERATLLFDVPKIKENTIYSRFQEIPTILILFVPLAYLVAKSRTKHAAKSKRRKST